MNSLESDAIKVVITGDSDVGKTSILVRCIFI